MRLFSFPVDENPIINHQMYVFSSELKQMSPFCISLHTPPHHTIP